MIIAVDFDGTIVEQDGRPYDDVQTPLKFLPGALEGLRSLKAAGHTLILWSGRANRALRFDPTIDPLVRAGRKRVDVERWKAEGQALNIARYHQMLDFVRVECPNLFDAVDDGKVGKVSADLHIDDKSVRLGRGPNALSWADVAREWGETPPQARPKRRGGR